MSARVLKSILIAAAVVVAGRAARAQDTQYWNQRYGTRAELLGGAVVGSFLDLSATYYNPGAIVMAENPDVLLSANAFEYISTKLTLGSGRDFPAATTFGTAPTLFAGLLPDDWTPGRLAYSALTRQQYNARIFAKEVGNGDVLPAPGVEEFSTEFLFDQRMGENWFGLTWSSRLRDSIGFGVTSYGAYRSQRTRLESLSFVSTASEEGKSLAYIDEFDYWYFRFVWKFGLALDYGPATLGFTMTTPSLGVFGGGAVSYTRSAIGIDVDGDGTPDDLYSSDYQDGLDTHYKSPVSMAAGGSYRWNNASLHLSAEWFDGVKKYDVIETGDVSEIFPDSQISRRVSQELGSVFNVGAGLEYEFNEHLTCYGAFTTDQSAAIQESTTRHSASTWDIYHVSAGSAFKISGLDLTLGVRYSFGEQLVSEAYRSIPSLGGDLLAGSKFEYRAWKGIIGFAFSL